MSLHGVLLFISEDRLFFFVSKCGCVSPVKGRAGVITGGFEIAITLNAGHLMEKLGTLMCERFICVSGGH